MSIKQLLNEYNELAKAHGKMKLTSWKQSKEKLEARLEELRELEQGHGKMKPKNKELVDKLIEKEVKRKIEAENDLNVVKIAVEEGFNPKVARAKLRRSGLKSNEGRWPVVKRGSKEHKELVELLHKTKQAS